MAKLPKEMKLTNHAQLRLEERKNMNAKYNIKNLMRSSVKWYGKDDLIHDCALYRHCCYTTRKSNQIGYITDGDIEVIYNKGTKTAITILEVKDKFKPIAQFIKPEILRMKEKKKEQIKMKKDQIETKIICADCGKEVEETNAQGICIRCLRRKANMKSRGKEYVRYLDLSEREQWRIDRRIEGQSNRRKKEEEEPPIILKAPDNENYYSSKANQTEVSTHPMIAPINIKKAIDPLSDQFSFIRILREYGCDIPEENLENILDVLINTDKLKDIFITIAKGTNQQALLDLEQTLNVVEKRLQQEWEFNGFQEIDDIKFKGFLTWRKVLKGAIFFWKKLYQTNTIIEMEKAWNSYTQESNNKISLTEERMDSRMKRFQITTDSISTIFNTRRPFTRVFYATDKDVAYNMFKQWMADRNLHEDPKKTTIVELKNDNSEDGRKG